MDSCPPGAIVPIRLGKRTEHRNPRVKEFVDLADLNDLVFGGWDIFPDNAFEAAMNADVQRSFKAMFPAPRQIAIDDLVVSELALRRMDHPTLLVHGRDDKIVPMQTSLYLLEHLPKSQLHIYGQCSHWIQVEYAKSFNQLLAQFFSGQI